jgi:hypothetical protein
LEHTGFYSAARVIALPALLISSPAPATVLQPAKAKQPNKAKDARILLAMISLFIKVF